MDAQSDPQVTYEDAILETLTLPEEVKEWSKKHPDFLKALKVTASDRFLHLGGVVHYPTDKVLGIYSYDYLMKQFKQDFIYYSDIKNPTFTLYTAYIRKQGGASKWVKDINDFFSKFDGYNNGIKSHHLSLQELLAIEGLPDLIKERAKWAINKGDELKTTGVRKLSQQELNLWMKEIKVEKQKSSWYIYATINN